MIFTELSQSFRLLKFNRVILLHHHGGHTNGTPIKRLVSTLTPQKITQLLIRNETKLVSRNLLPSYVRYIECNQLASNSPIEDRMRISSVTFPGFKEPTLILGVFDGHGGGTTADLISRRLFNYIAASLQPEPKLNNWTLLDLHSAPKLVEEDPSMKDFELELISQYKDQLPKDTDTAAKIKASFKRCDDDLSSEIQHNLINRSKFSSQSKFHYYLSAAVSGCCAIVMIIHDGVGYLASTGDCRAVLGAHTKLKEGERIERKTSTQGVSHSSQSSRINAVELNDEHNCDNINEIKRLVASHPKSEQNTMIKYNRLLGHLMPFRAFGDFNYKWTSDIIKACGITRAFGSGVIPSNYNTPPYLIAEPDVTELKISDLSEDPEVWGESKYLVMASDGLWELFESSRDVVEAVADHSLNATQKNLEEGHYDSNVATHILRSALCFGSSQDCTLDEEEIRKIHHLRLESTLTLPQAVVRNFRDDITIILVKLV